MGDSHAPHGSDDGLEALLEAEWTEVPGASAGCVMLCRMV